MKTTFDARLLQLEDETGLCRYIDCTAEENEMYLEMQKQNQPLPYNIVRRSVGEALLDEFCRIVPMEVPMEKIRKYCALRNAKNINTIKNCILFFTTLAIISLALSVILTIFR